jgi:hypothetical protein
LDYRWKKQWELNGSTGDQERDELERKAFLDKIATYEPEQLIYMDESGINNNEVYEYGWNEKGSRYYSKKPGVRARNVSAELGLYVKNSFTNGLLSILYISVN